MYTENELKIWINERLQKSVKSMTISIRNSKQIQDALLFYTKDYEDLSFSARANIVYYGNRPKCVVCNEYTYFNRNQWKFGETCSVKCGANNKRRLTQIKKTLLEKYGVDNISKSNMFHKKMKSINLEKYGVNYYFQSEDYKEKNKKTCREKYGVDSYSQTKEFKEKTRMTCQKKYGVDSYLQTKEFREKTRMACQKKYGASHQMQNLEVFEKQQKNSYYFKDYILPSGKLIRIQGYENKALDELLMIYNEKDLIIQNKDIFDKFGIFEYEENGTIHRYYPDIYIKPTNCFIEVKSIRTYYVNKKKNLLKRDAVLNKGYNFVFWVYGKNTKEIIT